MTHIPVLLREVLEIFEGQKIRTFFDGTLGAAGHASEILKSHTEIERYIGCDRDPAALELAKKRLEPWGEKVELIHGSYAEEIRTCKEPIDAFFIDIGVSSMQID